MNKQTLSESNFELWRLMSKLYNVIVLIRHKELNQRNIPLRQYGILGSIKDLGSKATLSEIAKQAERKYSVISRQVTSMEKDGLIKRIKDTPNSNLMRLEVTEKGNTVMEIARKNKSIDLVFSFLTNEERQQMVSTLNRILNKARKLNPD
jgi:DNA-binding MarR family transcriptional regulator